MLKKSYIVTPEQGQEIQIDREFNLQDVLVFINGVQFIDFCMGSSSLIFNKIFERDTIVSLVAID